MQEQCTGATMPSTPSPTTEEWKPPSDFDIVKEYNAHAGRLATMFGLLVAATSLSLATGAIHDRVGTGDSRYWPVYVALAVLGANLAFGALAIVGAIEPAVPDDIKEKQSWIELSAKKRSECLQSARAFLGGLAALAAAWAWSYSETLPAIVVLGVGCVVFAFSMLVLVIRAGVGRPFLLMQVWPKRRSKLSVPESTHTAGE
jgi:hypothetical protein